MTDDDSIVHLARFAVALRNRGIAVGIGDEVDALEALTLIDIGDRNEVHRALLVALKIQPRDRQAFEEVFGRNWNEGGSSTPRTACLTRSLFERTIIPSLTTVVQAGVSLGIFSTSTRHIRQLPSIGRSGW